MAIHTLNLLQLLNTFTNLGGTWPKWFILKGSSRNETLCDYSYSCEQGSIFLLSLPASFLRRPLNSLLKVCPSLFSSLHRLTTLAAGECVSEHGKTLCKEAHGQCIIHTDGYYIISVICLVFGVIFLVAFTIPAARRLQGESFYFPCGRMMTDRLQSYRCQPGG